jgi:hypothetical protein
MDYAGLPDAKGAFLKYLDMPGGIATERAFACRVLHRLTDDAEYLAQATQEAPDEPEAWERLAFLAYQKRDWHKVVTLATPAAHNDNLGTHCSDPTAKTKALDLLAVALWELGQRPEALTAAKAALSRLPTDGRLKANVEVMERILSGAA